MAKIDLTGHKFGRLTAIKIVENTKTGTYWNCVCECGNQSDVFIGHLRSGKTLSCGCLLKEKNKTHGKARTPTHISWCAMRNRVLSEKTNGYEKYGGRGITICDEWNNFEVFLNDMGERPSTYHVLDRINPNGNYEPGNCRWITKKESCDNRTCTRVWVVFGEEFLSSVEAAKKYKVAPGTIQRWCNGGFTKKGTFMPPREDCGSHPLHG